MSQHLFVTAICLFFACISLESVQAQSSENTSQHELGLRVSSPNAWGLIYKQALSSEKFWRLRAASANVVFQSDAGASGNFSAVLGLETRKQLAHHELRWYHGPEAGATVQLRRAFVNEGIDANMVFRFNYVLGLRYEFNDWLWVEGETNPGIFVSYSPTRNNTAVMIGTLLNTSILAFTAGATFN